MMSALTTMTMGPNKETTIRKRMGKIPLENTTNVSKTTHGAPHLFVHLGPFVESIMAMELPNYFKLLMILTSDNGTGDHPTIHVTKLKSIMLLNSAIEPPLCRAFHTFFEGSTFLCFSNFPKGLIHDFEQFSKAFTNHFFLSRIYTWFEDALNYIKQGQNEPLQEYL